MSADSGYLSIVLKELLKDKSAYKDGMSLEEMKNVYDNIKNKETLEAEGLYEEGMTSSQMSEICDVLKISKLSANSFSSNVSSKEEENILKIEQKFNETDLNKIDNNEFKLNTHIALEDEEILNKQETSKNLSEFNFKKFIWNIKKISPLQVVPFSIANDFFFKLPMEERIKYMNNYLVSLEHISSQHYTKNWDKTIKWGNPIYPLPSEINIDKNLNNHVTSTPIKKNVDYQVEDKFTNVENVLPDKKNNDNDFRVLRSNRLIKKVNYKENSDEENDTKIKHFDKTINSRKRKFSFLETDVSDHLNKTFDISDDEYGISNKKQTKGSIEILNDNEKEIIPPIVNINKTLSMEEKSVFLDDSLTNDKDAVISKNITESTDDIFDKLKAEDEENKKLKSPEIKFSRKRKPMSTVVVNDRTRKMIDNIKSKKYKNKRFQNLSSSESENEDDIFVSKRPFLITTKVDVHEIPNKVKGRGRQNVTMRQKKYTKFNISNGTGDDEDDNYNANVKTNGITTSSFYGTRSNKNTEVVTDINSNYKSDRSECPICHELFALSYLEIHASSCSNFQQEEICNICTKVMPRLEYYNHKCHLNDFFNQTIVPSNQKNSPSKENDVEIQNGTKLMQGYRCKICDKFIQNEHVTVHASNCIAIIK